MATSAVQPGTSQVSTLSDYAGPYVTEMLGKTQALTQQPYQTYGGPLTADASELQNKVFQGLGNLNFPSNLGQSFSNTGAYAPPPTGGSQYGIQPIGTGQDGTGAQIAGGQVGAPYNIGTTPMTGATTPSGMTGMQQGIASQYMNPYLQNVLDPQLAELRRQNDITQSKTNAGLTSQGAFGGGRQAIMNSENNRNLMNTMNQTVGTGYANAYDKAMQQFNTEQGQGNTLANLLAQQGNAQRDITQQGVTADYNEFAQQRDYPQKMLQFQQSMLQGLPISTVYNQPAQQSGIGQLSTTVGGMGTIMDNLKKLGLA
jgi:hypothetical protein